MGVSVIHTVCHGGQECWHHTTHRHVVRLDRHGGLGMGGIPVARQGTAVPECCTGYTAGRRINELSFRNLVPVLNTYMVPNKNTFCVAPYQHVTVNSVGFLKVCCTSKEKPEFKYNDIEKWLKSDTLLELRHNLSNGIENPICETCWTKEKTGKISQRQVYNKHIGKIIESSWDKNFIKNEILKDSMKEIRTENLRSFDLQLGNLCNLKCIMCSPKYSSQLLVEARMNPSLENYYKDKITGDYNYAEKTQFKHWCNKYLTKPTHIKFTGGEPFMNPYLLETIKAIPNEQKNKCILHFTTNLTKINEKILELFALFKEVWISVSVEGIGDMLEYARFGHKWQDLEKNLTAITGRDKVYVSVSHVIQAPTFVGIKNLVKYFDKKKLKLEPIFLTTPDCYQLDSIKTKYKEIFLQDMQEYTGFNKEFVESVRNFVSRKLDYSKKLAQQCVSRMNSFDKVRKSSFTSVVPLDYFV